MIIASLFTPVLLGYHRPLERRVQPEDTRPAVAPWLVEAVSTERPGEWPPGDAGVFDSFESFVGVWRHV